MTEEVRPIFKENTLSRKTGSWRDAELKQKPRYLTESEVVSPCEIACPLENDIPYWISLLKDGKIKEAWERLITKNPLPAVTGRVCPAFCEKKCNRKEFDQAVSIRELEKFLGDEALVHGWRPAIFGDKMKPFAVAVVGSGPAGLSCAYQLARRRYQVTIFESLPVLGGMLRVGIPDFRLPKDILWKEIDNILQLGVRVQVGPAIDAKLFETLKTQYHAIFVAVGLQKSRRLNIPGEELPSVSYGLEFLKEVNLGKKVNLGKRVLVIGGGNTAIDVARTARRMGSEVAICYRRTSAEMPAIASEIEEALAEGIIIQELTIPYRILKSFDKYFVEFHNAELGLSDETGRKRPVPIRGSNFQEEFDNLIIAAGEEKELNSHFVESDKVFISEDAGTVAAAIGSGRRAAEKIEKMLSGKPLEEPLKPKIIRFSDLNLAYFKHRKRSKKPLSEAKRCFSCGLCCECENCFNFCPEPAVKKTGDRLNPYAIDYDYCKGCGICAKECPRGVIVMEEENESK